VITLTWSVLLDQSRRRFQHVLLNLGYLNSPQTRRVCVFMCVAPASPPSTRADRQQDGLRGR